MYSNELSHHGIKGMKWGIRRYQNYDGSLTAAGKRRYKSDSPEDAKRIVLKKGQELYRTTNKKEEHKGHAYVTINKKDAKQYEDWGDVHATYKALKDIAIPSEDERIKTAVDLIKNDDKVRMEVARMQIGFTKGNYKKLTNMSLDKIGDRPYKTFVASLDENQTIRDRYFQSLQEKGYNAVEDVMDQGFVSDMPLIIFDREQTLSKASYS